MDHTNDAPQLEVVVELGGKLNEKDQPNSKSIQGFVNVDQLSVELLNSSTGTSSVPVKTESELITDFPLEGPNLESILYPQININKHPAAVSTEPISVGDDQYTEELADRGKFLNQLDFSGELCKLQDAIIKIRGYPEALTVTDKMDIAEILQISQSLLNRCSWMTDHRFYEELRRLQGQVIEMVPPGHPNYPRALLHLGDNYSRQYQYFGLPEHLHKSCSIFEEARVLCGSSHPDFSCILHFLAIALWDRNGLSGNQDDLDRAISLNREALVLRPFPHEDRGKSLINLANVLTRKYEQCGERKHLDEAIEVHRMALTLCPPPHPLRSASLGNMSAALMVRYEETGRLQDISESILLLREALMLYPAPHVDRPAILHNLAEAMGRRYTQLGKQEDMDEAILLAREASLMRSEPSSKHALPFSSLAVMLAARYAKSGNQEDLDEAICLHREVLALSSAPVGDRSNSLHFLALALIYRYELGELYESLDEAIRLARESITLRPVSHQFHSETLCCLASGLCFKFKKFQKEEDLDEALCLYRQSVDIRTPVHPKFSHYSSQYGDALMLAYSFHQKEEYLHLAMNIFRSASRSLSSPLSTRFRVARIWAKYTESQSHNSALEAYEECINILPRLASLERDIGRRQAALVDTDGLARSAAIMAIDLCRYDQAIELLAIEAGRAVFWLQALQLRTPFDKLREIAPHLERELSQISSELERGTRYSELGSGIIGYEQKMSVEKQVAHFTELNDPWVKALEKVRQLNGFHDFLKSNTVSKLQSAALGGVIVLLIAGDSNSHALILTLDSVEYIHLSKVGNNFLEKLVSQIRDSAPKGRRGNVFQDLQRIGRLATANSNDSFSVVLKSLWHHMVAPKSECPPIVRWCQTGIFSFLPLHAAGIYASDMSSIDSASQYMVSSYTPTISALLSPDMQSLNKSKFQMLVAVEPKTLPSTLKELQQIEKFVPSESLVKLGLPGSPATIEQVLSHLSAASVAHFACHGKQYNDIPLQSALILDDGDLKISSIMQQRLTNASLAFLCACETAMGDTKAPDETIHLGAALIFAGFRGVIATMWSINDDDGPVIAGELYKHLFQGGRLKVPDAAQAARALHTATAQLRAQGTSFKRWISFIHL